jgi:hypothetical protein
MQAAETSPLGAEGTASWALTLEPQLCSAVLSPWLPTQLSYTKEPEKFMHESMTRNVNRRPGGQEQAQCPLLVHCHLSYTPCAFFPWDKVQILMHAQVCAAPTNSSKSHRLFLAMMQLKKVHDSTDVTDSQQLENGLMGSWPLEEKDFCSSYMRNWWCDTVTGHTVTLAEVSCQHQTLLRVQGWCCRNRCSPQSVGELVKWGFCALLFQVCNIAGYIPHTHTYTQF